MFIKDFSATFITWLLLSTAVFSIDVFSSALDVPKEQWAQAQHTQIASEVYTLKQPSGINGALEKIRRNIADFRNKYPQFDYGIQSMEGLYDMIANPEDIYGHVNEYSFARTAIFIGEVLVGGACEVVKSLSVFHPKVSEYGSALIALYATKSVLWGIDSYLNSAAKNSSVEAINVLQADPLLNAHVLNTSSQMSQISLAPVTLIAEQIIDLVKNRPISEEESKKLARLAELHDKLKSTRFTKKVFLGIGKIVSFITGVSTGFSIATSGQKSPPSYWLTLVAGGLDSIVDSANVSMNNKPIVQKYITVCEILCLASHFSGFHHNN